MWSREIDRGAARAGRRAPTSTLRHLDRDRVLRRFGNIAAGCAQAGLDLCSDPIPVAPAAHYLMGGIATDLDGATTIPGLYAGGECAATGVHGANRLASNSLLECFVFAHRAVEHGLRRSGRRARRRRRAATRPAASAGAAARAAPAHVGGSGAGARRGRPAGACAAWIAEQPRSNPMLVAGLIADGALRRTESRGGAPAPRLPRHRPGPGQEQRRAHRFTRWCDRPRPGGGRRPRRPDDRGHRACRALTRSPTSSSASRASSAASRSRTRWCCGSTRTPRWRCSSPTAAIVDAGAAHRRPDRGLGPGACSPPSAPRSTCCSGSPASPPPPAATCPRSRAPAPRSSTRARPRPGLRAPGQARRRLRRRHEPPRRPGGGRS